MNDVIIVGFTLNQLLNNVFLNDDTLKYEQILRWKIVLYYHTKSYYHSYLLDKKNIECFLSFKSVNAFF